MDGMLKDKAILSLIFLKQKGKNQCQHFLTKIMLNLHCFFADAMLSFQGAHISLLLV